MSITVQYRQRSAKLNLTMISLGRREGDVRKRRGRRRSPRWLTSLRKKKSVAGIWALLFSDVIVQIIIGR